MTQQLSFRSACAGDLPRLREFEQVVISTERPYSLNLKPDPIQYYDLESMLHTDEVELLVAEMGSQLVACGYARLEKSGSHFQHELHVYLGFMYVEPEYRGRGISGALLQALLEWGRGRGAGEARLDVYCLNEAAIRAYQKAGFQSLLLDMRRTL